MSVSVDRSAALPASIGGAALVDVIDRGIGRALELLCAALVVVETLILFIGVIARYVVHRPLVWSDELASTIFLWLGMLGAALAIRRGENLRMNTVVNRLPGTLRALAEPFTLAVTLAFIVMLLPAAIEHVKIEAIVITPTLEISSSWRAAAMPAGLVLMALFVVVRMASEPLRSMLVMLAAVVVWRAASSIWRARICWASAASISSSFSSAWSRSRSSPACRSRSRSAWRPSAISRSRRTCRHRWSSRGSKRACPT